MNERLSLFIILFFSALVLCIETQTLSISSDEANIFFYGHDATHYLVTLSTSLFGQNDLALRLPFIGLHLLSVILLYKIGKIFLKRYSDRLLSILLYSLLPGVNGAALLVNSSGIVMFLTLLFVYAYLKEYRIFSQLILIVSLFVDNSFAIFYIAIFIYALVQRKVDLALISLVLFSAAMYLYGFDTGGKPKGYFIDTFGIYTAIFSPLLFLYFIYTMYRILIKEEKNLLWYVSFVALIVSLMLSLRQKLQLDDFAPFVVLAVPLMVKVFLNSYRVRLPQFRKWHTVTFSVVAFSLVLNTLVCFLHKPLYIFLDNPARNFAIKHHIAKELASELQRKGMSRIAIADSRLALRLKFYGIENGKEYKLMQSKQWDEETLTISIKSFDKVLQTFYIYKS